MPLHFGFPTQLFASEGQARSKCLNRLNTAVTQSGLERERCQLRILFDLHGRFQERLGSASGRAEVFRQARIPHRVSRELGETQVTLSAVP